MNFFSSSMRGPSRPHAPRLFSYDESKLVRAAPRGDLHAFNQLVVRHQERAYRVAYHLLNDTDTASGITQNVIAHAYAKIATLHDESFEVWLLRLITARCTAYLESYPAPFAPRTELQRGIETLALSERITLILADLEKLAPQDIAAITHTDVATVRARLSRARRGLRDVLQGASLQNV
ncbi:MAG: hypothetical protein HY741_20500 [Chloroflexi bacterium]|nr:hypothetical protein [Chloroflexota bacterium]